MGSDRRGGDRGHEPIPPIYAVALTALLLFAAWAAGVTTSVHSLRREVAVRVGWLSALDGVEAQLSSGVIAGDGRLAQLLIDVEALQVEWTRAGEPFQRPASRLGDHLLIAQDRLSTHGAGSAPVAAALAQLREDLAEERRVISDDAASVTATLGERWQALYAVVVVAFVLGVANVALVVRLVRQSAAARAARGQLAWHAAHDPLTGVLGRAAALGELVAVLKELDEAPIALLMVDIDRLREVNEAHGPEVGDDLLRGVARRLKGAVRGDDFVGRFGGDEFLVVLPGCGQTAARGVAERIREQLDERIVIARREVRITVSVGLTTADQAAGHGALHLLRVADAALAAAKGAGRNRVVHRVAIPPGEAPPTEGAAAAVLA